MEKTGNSWDASEYVKCPNKFFPIEMDYGQVRDKGGFVYISHLSGCCVTLLLY